MITRFVRTLLRQLRRPQAIGLLSCALAFSPTPELRAQTEVSAGYRVSDEMKAKLLKPGDLTLRDTNFVEAMFAIRRVWGLNIVVGNDFKGETVSCEFSETPLHEILDTILSPRGYGYRPIGNSLVIIKQDTLGAMKPLFQSAMIAVVNADADEIKEALSLYLSENGQIQVIASAKSLLVVDFPERIEQIQQKAKELEDAAKRVNDEAKAAENAALLLAAQNAGVQGGGNPAMSGVMGPLPGSNNKVMFFDLKFTKAEALAPAIQPILNTLGRISVVPRENRLVVFDTEEKLNVVAEAVRELDVPRPQVRIAALIYDASLQDIRRCGVNWANTGPKGLNLDAAGVAQDSALLSATTLAAPGATNGALTLQSLGSSFDMTMVINALAQSKNSRLLADPNVTVYDMETAKIDLVTEIPFQQLTQSGQSGPIGTTAFREAGITLNVTPQIADDDTITMLVNPKFSILSGFTPGTNQPIIDRRETSTTVRVRNRETLVIGGLRQRNDVRNRTGIPYLMDLRMGIGELFKNKDADVRESELVVFITPEQLDMEYLGRGREHAILAESVPSLDTIAGPRIPGEPCPMEDWKHRCGKDCLLCKKRHCQHQCNGACEEAKRGAAAPITVRETPIEPGYEYSEQELLTPQAAEPASRENEPSPASPAEPKPQYEAPSPSDKSPLPNPPSKLSPVRIETAGNTTPKPSVGAKAPTGKSAGSKSVAANTLREPTKFAHPAAVTQRTTSQSAKQTGSDYASQPISVTLPVVEGPTRRLPPITEEAPATTSAPRSMLGKIFAPSASSGTQRR